jgi:hypothetical protein
MATIVVEQKANDKKARPYFIWNSDLTEEDVRAILAGKRGELEQVQMIAHIMQNARFEDIWQYLKLADIVKHWPLVYRMLWPQESKVLWAWALRMWGYNVQPS